MAKSSKIEWTHHTFNPWWGCVKVSPACLNCYAETWSKRIGKSDLWGKGSQRRFFSEAHWKEPLRWNKEAEQEGQRKRVFCASMADVFERKAELNPWRHKLWELIELTPWLDWLLLTKRPQNFRVYLPWSELPSNIWLGVTAENQKYFDQRIDDLLAIQATVHFLSCEPLLGEIDISRYTNSSLNWIIAGGESGHNSRPMNPSWVKFLRDQCNAAGIAFHFKQWGHWAPTEPEGNRKASRIIVSDKDKETVLFGLGKGSAGRVLDGVTWDEVPT